MPHGKNSQIFSSVTKDVNKNVSKRSKNGHCNDLGSIRVADPGVVWRAADAAGHVDLLRLKVELGVADVSVPANEAF